jgi:hypothetical protein
VREERRLATVLDELALDGLNIPETPQSLQHQITTRAAPGGLLYLRVVQPTSERAESLTAALLHDFRAELELENRRRDEIDRLVIEVSRIPFATPANFPPLLAALLGGIAGLAFAGPLLLLLAWLRYNRILAPLEAEQSTGAPTLAAIPRG